MRRKMVLIKGSRMSSYLKDNLRKTCFIIQVGSSNKNKKQDEIIINTMLHDIKDRQLSFLPLGGGYHYANNDVIQKAFLVVPNKNRKAVDDKVLFDFGKKMTQKYKQSKFLFIEFKSDTETVGQFFKGNGETCSDAIKNITNYDLLTVFFNLSINVENDSKQVKSTVNGCYRTRELYVSSPSNIIGSHARSIDGEIVIPTPAFYESYKLR